VRTTAYFENNVLRKRPYIQLEWCERALREPLRTEEQPDGRFRYWIYVPELDRHLRVVTLEDGETVHNAMIDRL
jgi:predicted ATPase